MAGWSETCRGTVAPWECDTTEHFTIAYYFDRLEQAAASLADRLDLDPPPRRRLTLRFLRELRAGATFHVESAPLRLDPVLRLGHRFVDSASGEIVTWIEEAWAIPAPETRRAAITGQLAAWDGPEIEERPEPASMAGAAPTARGRVRPADLDETGRFSLTAIVHRFTDALFHLCTAIGLSGEYLRSERRGFSTFELVLSLRGGLPLGAAYLVETGIAQLGNSSVRLLHRMSDAKSGAELARLGQFGVLLDLDARRPAPLPEAARGAAARLLLPAA